MHKICSRVLIVLSFIALLSSCSPKWAARVEQADFRSQVISAPQFLSAAKIGYSIQFARGVPPPRFSLEDKLDQALSLYFDRNSVPTRQSSGAQQATDAELRFVVTNIKERVGDRLSATQPAELGFSVTMVRSGKIVWQGDFFVRDHAVVDNLYRLSYSTRGGIHWRSVEDLATYGFELVAKDLAESRRNLMLDKR